MAVPITLRCDCGEEHKASLGQSLRCSCGKVYDTSTIPRASLAGVHRSQLRMRLYATLGLVFTASISVLALTQFGVRGLMIALPLAGISWFRVIGPPFRRRVFRGGGELPRWKLEATEAAEE